MIISEYYQDKLVKEIEYTKNKIAESDNNIKKIYYFSAVHGMIQKIFNFEYDSTLVFIHNVLQAVHQSLLSRAGKNDPSMEWPENYFETLIEYLDELKQAITKEKTSIYPILEKFSIITYVNTGNGNFLHEKGMLKFD